MMFSLRQRQQKVFQQTSDSGITVGLSLDLNKDLILEGIVRDIVRVIQSMKKKLDSL